MASERTFAASRTRRDEDFEDMDDLEEDDDNDGSF